MSNQKGVNLGQQKTQSPRKFQNRGKLIALLLFLVMAVPAGLQLFAAETDTDGYIMVRTVDELKAIDKNLTAKYKLYADIDLSAASWSPLGYGKFFKGTFDGNGHIISGLWSEKNGRGYKGLFSVLEGATVKNLTIVLDDRGITGIYECGGLTGVTQKGTVIDNVSVIGGKITVTGGGYAGGLIGISRGGQYGGKPDTITNCTVTDTATHTSGNYSGGFIGVLEGGSVIQNSHSLNTRSTGFSYVAGFVGASKSQSLIEYCTADGSADGTGSYPGGFVGVVYQQSTVKCSTAAGDVSAKLSYAGGFAGAVYNASDISEAYAYGNVQAKHYAGGLIGTIYDASTLFKSCAYGNVSLTGGYIAGGLAGEAISSTISNCYARGDVNGGPGSATGVGGLVGYFSLVGNKTVTNSYSSGTVVGKGKTEYGAFCGMTGVTFLGTNYYDSDKAGVERATGTSGKPKGLAASFPQGKGTVPMMKQTTFKGWDFVNIWRIDENETYPYFEWECETVTNPDPDGNVDVTAWQPIYEISWGNDERTTIAFFAQFTPADLETEDFFVSFTDAAGQIVAADALDASEPEFLPDISDGAYLLSFTISNSAAASVAANGDITVSASVEARQSNGTLLSDSDSTIIRTGAAPECSVEVTAKPLYQVNARSEEKYIPVIFDIRFTPVDMTAGELSLTFMTGAGDIISFEEIGLITDPLTLLPVDSAYGEYSLNLDFMTANLAAALQQYGDITAVATVGAEHLSGASASGSGSTTFQLIDDTGEPKLS
ncbi:MAG: hypothetical protein LBS84_08685 [Clostridiales bacterium]|jgi:hypothetical protein|nr:hypothetical protein [Clostridiales bacterium]